MSPFAVVALVLLTIPRFFLVPIADTGIRVEDVILLALFPYSIVLLSNKHLRVSKLVHGVRVHYLVVGASAVAAGLSGRLGWLVSLSFGLRPILYLSAFYIGYSLGFSTTNGRKSLSSVLVAALMLHVTYGIAVSLHVLPNVASFSPSRLSGLTNGPYELSAILCLTCVLFIRSNRRVLALIALAALVWTQSRISLVALPTYALFRGDSRSLLKWLLPIVALAGVWLVVAARGGSTGLLSTISSVSDVGETFSTSAGNREEYLATVYSAEADTTISEVSGDPSALVRAARWSMVVASAFSSASNLIIGMGPGYYSVALDGNYIRLLGESGLLGLCTFLAMMFLTARSLEHRDLRQLAFAIVTQLLVIGLFIDIFVSLKAMCLFWMFIGALKREDVRRRESTVD
jgi:hypothetical protein